MNKIQSKKGDSEDKGQGNFHELMILRRAMHNKDKKKN